MNRMCVWIDYKLVPVHDDEPYKFLTDPPQKIGDDAEIFVNGKREKVRLLSSQRMVNNSLYLVRRG